MRQIVFALTLFGAAMLATSGLTADEPKKDEAKLTKKEIAKMMKDAHDGAKSPHARTLAELKKDSPNWEEIAKDAKAFTAMSEAFKKVNLNYKSPDKYIESATALSKAAGNKDKKAANEAFTGLTKSCASCHSYGGVPGER